MKKILFCLFCTILLFTAKTLATNVQLNGKIIDFTDSSGNKVEAQIINSRTMVPLRKIFELLGCDVEWQADTQKITATKDNRKIVLQINNKNAEKIVNGVSEKILLDSVPVIVNDRTLVPLRFIAESLNKQVGWDAANNTVIIIDYIYFENILKTNAPALYYFLMDNQNAERTSNVIITRKYFDMEDSKNNNTSIVTAKINENKNEKISQNIKIDFSGNGNLIKDILQEKWNSIDINVIYNENGISYETSGVLSKMIGVTGEKTYDELKLKNNAMSPLEDAFKSLIDIKEININTFSEIVYQFNKLKNLFTESTSTEKLENGVKYTWNFKTTGLNYKNTKINYFDLTKLDNMVYDNLYFRAYSFINKNIFNYDIKLDELMYDVNEIVLNGKFTVIVNDNNTIDTEADINYKATNDYKEQFEYNVHID